VAVTVDFLMGLVLGAGLAFVTLAPLRARARHAGRPELDSSDVATAFRRGQ
jgi:hypothetical protein